MTFRKNLALLYEFGVLSRTGWLLAVAGWLIFAVIVGVRTVHGEVDTSAIVILVAAGLAVVVLTLHAWRPKKPSGFKPDPADEEHR